MSRPEISRLEIKAIKMSKDEWAKPILKRNLQKRRFLVWPLMVKVPVSPKSASGHRQVTPLGATLKSRLF
jgi:hypothetical protein